jgi:hypothetical protein
MPVSGRVTGYGPEHKQNVAFGQTFECRLERGQKRMIYFNIQILDDLFHLLMSDFRHASTNPEKSILLEDRTRRRRKGHLGFFFTPR